MSIINTLNHNEIIEMWNDYAYENNKPYVFENTKESFDQFCNFTPYKMAYIASQGEYSSYHTYCRVNENDNLESTYHLDKFIDIDALNEFSLKSEKWKQYINEITQ
jgi:hypothetical protein